MLIRLVAILTLIPALSAQSAFSGTRALQHARAVVGVGPRVPGSAAAAKARAYISTQVKAAGWQVQDHAFQADTPKGKVSMVNVIACRNLTPTSPLVVLSGHYDTKSIAGVKFVGANDGGSSTAFLIEMAKALPAGPSKTATCLVWFDGEEAYGEWSDSDSLYGSRALADKWQRDGTLKRIKALINVDMIGDKNLRILKEVESNYQLKQMIWQVAAEQKRTGFTNDAAAITDDHVPFLRRGVPAVDLIDFDFGPNNSYWHTERDTVDKLSAASLQQVGDVLLEVVKRLQR